MQYLNQLSENDCLTRMVATLGPSSSDSETIKHLIDAGVDVFRINFSHSTQKDHKRVIDLVKSVSKEMGKHIAILQDLGGPKLRINRLKEESIHLQPDDTIRMEASIEDGDENCIRFIDEDWFSEVNPGEIIVLGDGIIHLNIIEKDDIGFTCKILSGGILRSRAGMNFPHSKLNLGSMQTKDWDDLSFGIKNCVDAVALSFVKGPEDILEVRNKLEKLSSTPILIAKIERLEAVSQIDAILEFADGIMVARGDLGISVPMQKVPTIQKMLIKKAREKGKLVITATQMLESMTSSIMPTRAEVTDVANAVYDGTDAVMLSGETAIGINPPLVVKTMKNILIEAESNAEFKSLPKNDYAVETAISQVTI